MANGLLEPEKSREIFLVAETGCHYSSEIKFPEPVSVGLSVQKLGQSSVVFQIGLFAGEAGTSAALGRFVHVHVNRDTRRPVSIPDGKRLILETLTAD